MRFMKDLSQETLSLLQRIYRESKHYRVRQRAHCLMLSCHGYTAKELQKIFQVNLFTIYHWFDAWELRRFCGLYEKKGRGRRPKLNDTQREQIRQWAKEFPKNLGKIGALIQEEFGIAVSKDTLKRVLKTLRFSWHRIRRKVKGQPDPEEYQQKKQALEELQRREKQEEIDLYYLDESGFCLTPYVPYAWQEKGRPIVGDTSSSKRLNVLGLLSRNNDLHAYSFEGNIDSEVGIACIDDFCKNIKMDTFIVIDNAPIHTSDAFEEKITEWETKNLKVFRLPTYSPELNLIEILWRFIKYEWIEFQAYRSWKDLVEYVEHVIKNFGTEYEINFA
jgi:transposase